MTLINFLTEHILRVYLEHFQSCKVVIFYYSYNADEFSLGIRFYQIVLRRSNPIFFCDLHISPHVKFILLIPNFIVLLFPWFRVFDGCRFLSCNFLAPLRVINSFDFIPNPFSSILSSSQLCIWRLSLTPSVTAVHVAAHEMALWGTSRVLCLLEFWTPPCFTLTGTIFLSTLCAVLRLIAAGLHWELFLLSSCSILLRSSKLSSMIWLLFAESLIRSLASATHFDSSMIDWEIMLFRPLLRGEVEPSFLISIAQEWQRSCQHR